ncbi:MAG: DUF1932 domain-containing protein [Burkholderiaceae bacterium]
MKSVRLGLVGFGEVGRLFGAGLKPGVEWVGAWDLKLRDASMRGELSDAAERSGVRLCESAAALLQEANFLISAVTASQALSVAEEAAGHIQPGAVFLDLNSASPGTKQRAAKLIEDAGGRYLEAGVMTSVPPYGVRVPMLIGGPHAQALLPTLQALGLDAKVASDDVGVASATKMCRSVMIKGLEALVLESYATARHYGVEDAMLATLQETFPGVDWQQQGSYFFSRVAQHGKRRAEEMREAANTVREAGFEPVMASAIATKHDWMARLAREGRFAGLAAAPAWQDFADRMAADAGPSDNTN